MALPLLGLLGLGATAAIYPHWQNYSNRIRGRSHEEALAGLDPDASQREVNRALFAAGLLDPQTFASGGVTMRGQDITQEGQMLAHQRGMAGIDMQQQRLALARQQFGLQQQKFGWMKHQEALGGLTAMREAVPGMFAPPSVGGMPYDPNLAMRAIGGRESGNNYSAVNEESGALGRYQVMPENVGPWSKRVLGREISTQEFLENPELQDQIFHGIFGSYVEQYGWSDAVSRWFSGVGLDQAIAQGRHDGNVSVPQYTATILQDIWRMAGQQQIANDPVHQEAQVRGSGWLEMSPEERRTVMGKETAVGVMGDTIDYLEDTTAAGRVLSPEVSAQMETEWQLTVLPALQELFQAGAMQEAELRLFERLAGNGFSLRQFTDREVAKMRGVPPRLCAGSGKLPDRKSVG